MQENITNTHNSASRHFDFVIKSRTLELRKLTQVARFNPIKPTKFSWYLITQMMRQQNTRLESELLANLEKLSCLKEHPSSLLDAYFSHC